MSIYNSGYPLPDIELEPDPPALYRYFLVRLKTDQLIAEIPFTGVSWGRKVSGPGEFSGTIPVLDVFPGVELYTATIPGEIGLFVMRGSLTVFGGIIMSRSYDASSHALQISASSFESYLSFRHIWHTLTYVGVTDPYDVVRDLVYRMQNDFDDIAVVDDHVTPVPLSASIGLLVEAGPSAHTLGAVKTWAGGELISFADAINQIADNLYGFEWNIECVFLPDEARFERTLMFRDSPPHLFPSGVEYVGTRPGINTNIWEFPGNIMDISLGESIADGATRYFVVGGLPEGVESDYKPRGSWNNDQYLDDGWLLFEEIESSKHSTASLQATLDNYATVYGRRAAPPVPDWSVTVNGDLDPKIGTFDIGDWCRLTVHDAFIEKRLEQETSSVPGTTVKRIMGFSVSVPDVPQRPEAVTLELADEWDESA